MARIVGYCTGYTSSDPLYVPHFATLLHDNFILACIDNRLQYRKFYGSHVK